MTNIPHIRYVEHPVADEDPPVIAMRNIPFKLSEYERRLDWRRPARAFFWGVMLFLAVAAIVMNYGEDLMAPRAQHYLEQVAAGIFLLMVLTNFVVECGWSGGGKDINRSNTDVI